MIDEHLNPGTGFSKHSDRNRPVVPDVVVERLPLYVRVLSSHQARDVKIVSSEQLGSELHMTPAQIRKDLSYFGRFGKQGRGYNVSRLAEELRQILGLNRSWNAALVGVGRLGRAILSYPGFRPEGFNIVAAFDADSATVGESIDGITIESLERISVVVSDLEVEIGIVAVPSKFAQPVIDRLVDAGIGAILNYAPITTHAPDHVKIQNIDPVISLQSMTYYLK